MNLDAGLILGAIGSLMVTHFLYSRLRDRGAIDRRRRRRLDAGLERDRARGSRRCRADGRASRRDDRLLAARPDPADVPQLPALLQAHPPARRAAEHLRAQPQRAPDGPAEAQPRGREPVGRRPVTSSSRGRACSTPTRAPSARAARTTAPRTTPARTCRRCSSSTTSATRCSIASGCATRSRELEKEVAGLDGVRRRRNGYDDAHPHPDLVFARDQLAAAQGRAREHAEA